MKILIYSSGRGPYFRHPFPPVPHQFQWWNSVLAWFE